MNPDNNSKYILSSLDNALSILNLFITAPELTPIEISALSGINRSTVFRMLVTLESRGYLLRDDANRYRLGLKLFTLGQLVYSRAELVSIIHPYLAKLMKETGESSHLSILDDTTHVVFLDKVVSDSLLKMDTPLGFHQQAHLTGTGKAILAFESEQVVNQYIKLAEFSAKTEFSIKTAKEFLEILETIRENGYACDEEESEIGLTCFAVPVFDASGHPIAAISCSGPTTRMNMRKEQHIQTLQSIAQEIHKILS
ncbi:IclR family transcriptional regulator domain-containing protein [Anaerotignum sp.]